MANTTPTLTDLFNSPEHNGEMNESVRKQIEQALAKTKNTTDKPKRKSRSSKKSSKATASLSELISSPEYTEEMNKSVRKQIEQALAKQAKKKKLPTKPKIDLGDSVVIVDKNENVSTVVPAEAKPQGNVPVEVKTQERQGDRQSLKGMAKAGALSLGSSIFNKMFPTLGKGLDILKSRLEKQEKTTTDNNVANKSYSRQVERSSVFLNTMSENLNKSNDLLQQILVVVNKNAANNQAPAADGGMGGFPNIDLPDGNRGRSQPRRAQTVPNTQSSAKPRITGGKIAAIGAGVAAVGATGYMAYNAITGGNRNNAEPAVAPAPVVPQSPPAPAPGTTHDITTGMPIGASAAPAAARVQTPSPAATVNPAEAARAREEELNSTAQRYQASVEERARIRRERAALEERYGQTDTERTVRPEPGSNVHFSPYKEAAYSDPEAQRQYSELNRRESRATIQRDESFRSAARNMASTTRRGLSSEDADVTPEMIQALTTRYGYTSEQLQRYGGGATQENFVRVGGIFYSNAIRRLFDDELKKDLERRAAAAQQPATQNKDASDGSGSGEETGGSGGDATPVQTAAVTSTQNVTPAATPAAAPGTEYDITTGMPIGAPAATVAPAPTQNTNQGAPVATREQSSTELTVRQKRFVDRFLRSNQLQDDDEIRSIAENIVKQRNMPSSAPESFESDALRTLVQQEQLRRASLDRGTFIANKLVIPGRPLTNIQMSMIEIAGVERYPQFIIDQYNRQKSGNATPEPASTTATTATQQQIPEGATPVRSNDRVIGYMPAGGGPTVTFTNADRQTLEGARTQLTGSRSSAPAATPVAASSPSTTTEQSSNELTDQQKQFIDYFLRYNNLQDNEEARYIAEYIVKRRNMPGSLPNIASRELRSLVLNELRRRAERIGGMLIDNNLALPGRPLTAAQMSRIERAGVQHYPQYVIDQYNRQKSGNATPEPTSITTDGAAIAQSSTNEAASNTQTSPDPASRPGIRMGREIGESSRVAAPSPTATTPATASNETEEQIYNRLIQEQPENFRNNIDVQNDARTEARLTARAGQSPQTATPEASGYVNPMTDPSGFNARILNVRAQEILFKADKFEYSEGFQLAAASPTPAPGPAVGGEGPSSAGGSTPGPAPTVAVGGSAQGAAAGAPAAASAPGVTQIGSANITGLDFAAGVDQRIKPGIADKTKEIQSTFGKKLMVTSGFRDPARNSRVGGAGGSKHLTGDAVDVQFPGNQQETIDLIKVASEKGAGGIGVYRPGFLHIDTGAKRVWGPDYKATSIPDWAKPALDEHMGKPASQSAGGGAAAGGGETASPMPQQAAEAPSASPSAPAATPEPSSPSSGATVSSASVADETASRPSTGPTPPAPDTTSPITAAPQGPSLPGIDPNNPGPVEPADAAIRYSRLFNMAA